MLTCRNVPCLSMTPQPGGLTGSSRTRRHPHEISSSLDASLDVLAITRCPGAMAEEDGAFPRTCPPKPYYQLGHKSEKICDSFWWKADVVAWSAPSQSVDWLAVRWFLLVFVDLHMLD